MKYYSRHPWNDHLSLPLHPLPISRPPNWLYQPRADPSNIVLRDKKQAVDMKYLADDVSADPRPLYAVDTSLVEGPLGIVHLSPYSLAKSHPCWKPSKLALGDGCIS